MAEGFKIDQRHGKSRVRVARVWRPHNRSSGGAHVIVEWGVDVSLFSDCLPAYSSDDNSSIVATDSMKNTVYGKAKECTKELTMEQFAILLARHFTTYYPQVTGAIVSINEKPWERVFIDGKPHSHGFKLGSEMRTTEVTMKKCGAVNIISGLKKLSLLKTTQSGFEGFVRDKYTILPDTRERIVATEVTSSWRCKFENISQIPPAPFCFRERYDGVKKVLTDTFFGPVDVGVYSPSVQNTLYLMATAVLNRFQDIEWVHLRMPNIHFLPLNLSSKENPNMVKFADDVYLPTDEPHGTIQATISRAMSKL